LNDPLVFYYSGKRELVELSMSLSKTPVLKNNPSERTRALHATVERQPLRYALRNIYEKNR